MIEITGKNTAKLVYSSGSREHRKRRARRVTFTGKKELERMHRAFLEEMEGCANIDVSVCDLVASYIDNRELLGVRETTIHGYRIAEKRIERRFSGVKANLSDR